MTKAKRIFCNGLLCHKNDRKNKCVNCGIEICGLCSYYSTKNELKPLCVDCAIDTVFNETKELNILPQTTKEKLKC